MELQTVSSILNEKFVIPTIQQAKQLAHTFCYEKVQMDMWHNGACNSQLLYLNFIHANF
jgi:hypothetical protein